MKDSYPIVVPSTVVSARRPVDSWIGMMVTLNPAPPWRQFWARVRWCWRSRQLRAPKARRIVGYSTDTVTLR